MNEITQINQDGDTALSVPAQTQVASTSPGALLSAIVELAKDRSIDKEMLAFLMDRQERMEDRQAEADFNAAMSEAQGEIAAVVRDRVNEQTRSKYATLYAINAVIRPIYVRHGFSLSFGTEAVASSTTSPARDGSAPPALNNMRVVCDVSRGRHTKRYYMDAPPDTLGPKGAPVKTVLHGMGSTMMYLKNKLTCGIFNVVLRNEDDDGVAGGRNYITEAEADELRALCKAVGRMEGPLLDHMFGGAVRSFDEIERGAGYLAVKNTLLGMQRAQQKKQGA